MITMLLKSLGASDWAKLLSLVSPAFFKVVPFKELSRAVSSGVKLSKEIDKKNSLVKFSENMNKAIMNWQKNRVDGRCLNTGDVALRIYFAMIFARNEILLDVSSKSFQTSGLGGNNSNQVPLILWSPGAVAYPFQQSFLESLRLIYAGFYLQDKAAFERGLAELGLLPCADAFRELFGSGDQTAVPFRMSDFTAHFHRIFTLCKEHRIALHGDFVALGVFLSFLYEHLEGLAQNSDIKFWDARAAFKEGSGFQEASM